MLQLDAIEVRKCTKCGEEKPATEEYFYARGEGNHLRKDCKICTKIRVKEWVAANPTKVNRNWRRHYATHRDEQRKRQRVKNAKAEVKKHRAAYYQTNKTRICAHRRKYRRAHPECPRKHHRRYHQKHSEDPSYRLNNAVRSKIRGTLRGTKAGRSWETLVDFTPDELREHLESLLQPGMTWENYGGRGGWWIDHIRPLSSFSYTTAEDPEFKECWSLANLQPLWAKDNMSKGDKWKPPE